MPLHEEKKGAADPDHFSSDYLPDDAAFICQNEIDAEQLEKLGYTNQRWFDEEEMHIGGVTVFGRMISRL